jgi:hypothetical protein
MQIGLTNTTDPNILKLLISSETESIKRPPRIHLSTSSNDCVIHNSYIGKSVFDICNVCHKSLSRKEPHLIEMRLKTYDGDPWPSCYLRMIFLWLHLNGRHLLNGLLRVL